MIKICYVTTISLSIESFFIPQLQYLADNGFDVTVVCSNDAKLQDKLGDSVRFNPIFIPRGIKLGGSFKAIKELTKFFKREQFDIIQYSTPNAAFYSSIAARMAGCNIRNYHMMGLRYLGASGLGRGILKTLEKITCNNSTSIECVSNSNMKLGIEENLFNKDKATVVFNGSTGGVDLDKFNYSKRDIWRGEVRKEIGVDAGDFLYGFVGRITRDKGINELLSTFLDRNDNSKLLLLGEIEENNGLDTELLNKAMHHENIIVHPFVEDVERYFAAIDVLVLPSYREGFGNVVIEAAAMGTPAIVSNIPGPIDTIIDNETAITIETHNVKALSNAMDKIRKMELYTMGNRAHTFVEVSFDSAKLCEKVLERKNYLLKPDK